VKSRWLWRLETLARGAGVALPVAPDLLAHTRALDRAERFRPAPRPRPRPPVQARPRELAVTAVETWIRDPYALYARRVLDLRPLNRPDEPVGPRERGSALHKAFERFAELHPLELPADAEDEFARLMREALVEAGMAEPAMAREGALADRSAPWAAAMEARRRHGCRRLVIEHTGVLPLPDVNFTVTAKADRLEVADCGGGLLGHVIDFKTGGVPSRKELVAGLAPQLTLTAAILAAGGFQEAGPVEPGQLVYLKITGRREAGREEVRAEPGESAALAATALEGLKRRVRWFDEEATPYLSRAIPKLEADRGGDYDHLARVWEWSVIAGDDEEAVEP
jgi:ATP-dependent helicase/nuclease subunit B